MPLFSHTESKSTWYAGNAAAGRQAGQRHEGGSRPRRTLPSGRSSPAPQINVVLALAVLGSDSTPVQRAALARHVGKSAATVSDSIAFLADLGLVRGGRGQYAITEQGQSFAWMWPRDSARARLLLRPLLQAHWSAAAAARHLAGGPLDQEELAKRLRTGLPGVPLRGMYMVEWLVIGLVLVRDEQLRIHLAPPRRPATPGRHGGGPENPGPGAGSRSRCR